MLPAALPVAAQATSDPIFAAIERHKAVIDAGFVVRDRNE
jgi:hypothetical protein